MNARGSGDPKLSVRDATKLYSTGSGNLLAIDRCSLDVAAGEIVSIVGPSGCGKTTLLWLMSGLHGLTAGFVRLGIGDSTFGILELILLIRLRREAAAMAPVPA